MSNAVWLFWQSFFYSGRNFLENSGYGWDPPPTFSCLCPQQLVCWRKIHHWGRLVLPSNCMSNNTGIPNSACVWSERDLPSSRHFALCQKSVLMSWFSKNKVLYCHLSETCHDKYINLRCLWGEQCPSEVRQPCAMPTQLYIVARMTSLNQALTPLNVFSQICHAFTCLPKPTPLPFILGGYLYPILQENWRHHMFSR